MKINKLNINGYGKLEDRELKFNDGINIVYGTNEAGKSTLLSYIESSLFGISKTKDGKDISDKDKYLPWSAKAFSGTLNYTLDNGDSFEVFNDFSKRQTKIFDKTYTDISSKFEIDKARGNRYITEQTNLTKDLFENTNLIKQCEVKTNDGYISNIIQRLSNRLATGSEDVSYKKVKDYLKNKLLKEVGTSKTLNRPINVLNQKFEILDNEIEELKKFVDRKYVVEDEIVKLNFQINVLINLLDIILEHENIILNAQNEGYKKDLNKEIEDKYIRQKEDILKQVKSIEDDVANLKKQLEKKTKQIRDKKKKNVRYGVIATICAVILNILGVAILKRPLSYLSFATYLIPIALFVYASITKKGKEDLDKIAMQIKELQNEVNKKYANADIIDIQLNDILSNTTSLEEKVTNLIEHENINFKKSLLEFIFENYEDLSNEQSEEYLNKYLALNSKDIETKLSQLKVELHKLEYEKENINPNFESYIDKVEQRDCVIRNLKYLKEKQEVIESASNLVDRAYEEIQKDLSPKFSKNLSEIIGFVTDGKYTMLTLNSDGKLILKNVNNEVIDTNMLSVGTIDQIYLAFRLSTLVEMTDETIPIFLDETFAYYDEYRLKNIFKFLNERYNNYQIIVFTCSNREKKILDELSINYNFINL